MQPEGKTLELDHFVQSIYHNKGLATLVGGGAFGLFFSSDREWRSLYALLIGVGLSGILFWVFSFKLFKEDNFSLFYILWVLCSAVKVVLFIFIIFILYQHLVNPIEVIDRYLRELTGFLIGFLITSILIEINLRFNYIITIDYKKR